MDSARFDRLVTALGRSASRRTTLGALLAALLAPRRPAPALAAAAKGKRKGKGRGRAKCRAAGHPCEGNQRCCEDLNLVCAVSGPGAARRCTPCAAGQTACAGVCVDTATDPLNCGSCGTRCQLNAICDQGQCACVVPACQDFRFGFTCCPAPNDVSCACGLSNPGTVFTDPLTCDEIPAEDCPPERRCVGPDCQACCPVGSECDPSTGTCLQ
jgi:hypothetical protein